MSFGLRVNNNENYIQIDSDKPRLCAIYSGSYQAIGNHIAVVVFPAPITTTEPPCIFIRNSETRPDDLYMVMTVTGGPGNWTGFSIEAASVSWRPTGKWFASVFASKSTATWGLRMWDSSGTIIYDSGATPVTVTKATNSWSFEGTVSLTIGNAYYYRAAVLGSIASDEYFMLNPFSRGILAPSRPRGNSGGVRFNYAEGRLQLYSVGTTGWSDNGQPGVVFARLPGT